MFGPNITRGDLLSALAVILAAGALLGIGCNAGCNYLRSHVAVGWTP
jgi:hypothetical protein